MAPLRYLLPSREVQSCFGRGLNFGVAVSLRGKRTTRNSARIGNGRLTKADNKSFECVLVCLSLQAAKGGSLERFRIDRWLVAVFDCAALRSETASAARCAPMRRTQVAKVIKQYLGQVLGVEPLFLGALVLGSTLGNEVVGGK